MSQVKLSKTQLAALDVVIADAQERGVTSLGTSDCFIDCIVQTVTATTPIIVATVGGAAHQSEPISVAKLIEYRKNH
jgi:hypothetical protein